ncbi:MAG: sigma-70 family RNA polymerase sigma factor [Acidiferrobacterales bacterium]
MNFNEVRVLGEALKAKPLPWLDQLRLLKKAKDGDAAARETIIRTNLRLVAQTVSKMHMGHADKEDMFSAGLEGLNRAIDRFNPTKGCKFSTYAVQWINMEVKKFAWTNYALVMPSKKWSRKVSDLPTQVSLDRSLRQSKDGEVSALQDFFASGDPTPEEVVSDLSSKRYAKKEMKRLLGELSSKEAYIIRERYLTEHPRTLGSIAEVYQLSRERIRQLEAKALAKMAQLSNSRKTYKEILKAV